MWPWILVGSGIHGVALDVIRTMAIGNVASVGMLNIKALVSVNISLLYLPRLSSIGIFGRVTFLDQ